MQSRQFWVTRDILLRKRYPSAWWTKFYQKIKSWTGQKQKWRNGSCILVGDENSLCLGARCFEMSWATLIDTYDLTVWVLFRLQVVFFLFSKKTAGKNTKDRHKTSKRASVTVRVTLTVTHARLLVLRSSPQIFEEKRECSQPSCSYQWLNAYYKVRTVGSKIFCYFKKIPNQMTSNQIFLCLALRQPS